MPKRKISHQKLKVNTYRIMELAVEQGLAYGYRRAYKYTDNPTEEQILQDLLEGVMSSVAEWFIFEDSYDTR